MGWSIMTNNCIVVGNSASLLFNEFGEKIDSFDVVVRLNSFEIEGYEKHVGTKTTIWARTHGIELAQKDGSKFDEVWLKPGWDTNYNKEEYNFYSKCPVLNWEKTQVFPLKTPRIDNLNCTTGFSAICTAMLRCKDPITIVGFTFFTGREEDNSLPHPHYYTTEPPMLGKFYRSDLSKWLHQPVEKERLIIQQWHKDGKINLMWEDEVYKTLDYSKIPDYKIKSPAHLKGTGITHTCGFDGEIIKVDNPELEKNENYDHAAEKRRDN
jgi:hypothetical protein